MSYTVVALAADPLARAELGAFLDGLELLVLAELAPDDLDGFLDGSTEPYALVWEVDGTDALLGALPDVPLLALVSSPEEAAHALRQGAAGVLGRDTDGERLLAALAALTAAASRPNPLAVLTTYWAMPLARWASPAPPDRAAWPIWSRQSSASRTSMGASR